MSANNGHGVIRVGRKGLKKFAFGEDGAPFEVDVVEAFQAWIVLDETFRDQYEDRAIPNAAMAEYHAAAVAFVTELSRRTFTPIGQQPPPVPDITKAEALDFLARLREQYDEVAIFFQPKSREERDSPDSSEVELQFSTEAN